MQDVSIADNIYIHSYNLLVQHKGITCQQWGHLREDVEHVVGQSFQSKFSVKFLVKKFASFLREYSERSEVQEIKTTLLGHCLRATPACHALFV